jgi:competence protein ComEC
VRRQALLFLLGVLAALLAPYVPPPRLAALLAATGLLPLLGAQRWRVLAGFTLGLGLTLLQLAPDEAARLRPADEERRLLDCRIVTLPAPSGIDTQFDARCRPARGGGRDLRLALRWSAAPPLHVGEAWRLLVQLKAPRIRANPGSADGVQALRRQHLHGFGRVLASPLDGRREAGSWSVDRVRERIAANIARAVPERDAAALIAALAVGDTRRVSAEQWRVFNATGLTHLVAISGLHVTLFGLLAAGLARRLWGTSAWLAQRAARESCALLFGLAAAAAYALLAGFSVPAQRTLIMLASWCLSRLLLRSAGAAPPLALALFGVLLLDPCAPLAPGFWLSFVAVGALMIGAAGTPAAHGLGARLRELWRAQWVVAAALLPVTVAAFGTLSWAGLALNFIAIPLFSCVLVPLILAGVAASAAGPGAARPLFAAAARIIEAIAPPLQAVADLDGSLWRLAAPPWWYVLGAAAALAALLPWRPRVRLCSGLALLPALFPPAAGPAPGELRLTLLDTGRSLAVIARTAHHSLLYDVGESYGSGGGVTARTVLPALRALRVDRLDLLLLPRLTRDRSAGVTALLAALPVGRLLAGEEGGRPPEFAPCRPGRSWDWDGVHFELLAAAECVMRVTTGGDALLLTGDLGPEAQRELVARGLPPTRIVQVPRHGAASGLEPALQAATRPQIALVAATAAGAADGSVAATLARWRAGGAEIRVTGERGAIELRMPAALGIMPRPVAAESSRRCGKSCAPADR